MGYINEHKPRIIEGELRCKELGSYLEALELEEYVWISEDGSGIITRVEFDPKTNQMVGLVLPVNSLTGMPVPFTFNARNADEIQENMKKKKSSHVYLVMAQPLKKGVPPFILQLFGTDNKFSSQNVHFRWNYTIKELNR